MNHKSDLAARAKISHNDNNNNNNDNYFEEISDFVPSDYTEEEGELLNIHQEEEYDDEEEWYTTPFEGEISFDEHGAEVLHISTPGYAEEETKYRVSNDFSENMMYSCDDDANDDDIDNEKSILGDEKHNRIFEEINLDGWEALPYSGNVSLEDADETMTTTGHDDDIIIENNFSKSLQVLFFTFLIGLLILHQVRRSNSKKNVLVNLFNKILPIRWQLVLKNESSSDTKITNDSEQPRAKVQTHEKEQRQQQQSHQENKEIDLTIKPTKEEESQELNFHSEVSTSSFSFEKNKEDNIYNSEGAEDTICCDDFNGPLLSHTSGIDAPSLSAEEEYTSTTSIVPSSNFSNRAMPIISSTSPSPSPSLELIMVDNTSTINMVETLGNLTQHYRKTGVNENTALVLAKETLNMHCQVWKEKQEAERREKELEIKRQQHEETLKSSLIYKSDDALSKARDDLKSIRYGAHLAKSIYICLGTRIIGMMCSSNHDYTKYFTMENLTVLLCDCTSSGTDASISTSYVTINLPSTCKATCFGSILFYTFLLICLHKLLELCKVPLLLRQGLNASCFICIIESRNLTFLRDIKALGKVIVGINIVIMMIAWGTEFRAEMKVREIESMMNEGLEGKKCIDTYRKKMNEIRFSVLDRYNLCYFSSYFLSLLLGFAYI